MQRVLIVDDDKSLRSALSIMLGNAGYATSEAKDGIEALKSFDDQHPDLVIMDIMLPRLNGIEVSSNPLRYQQSAESGTASQRAWYPG